MRFTGTILAAKATSGVDVVRVLRAFDFGPPAAGNDGWFVSEGQRTFDSHWAYLIAAEPGSEPMVIVLTPKALRAHVL